MPNRTRTTEWITAAVLGLLGVVPVGAHPVSIKTLETDAAAGTLRSFSLESGLRWGDDDGTEHVTQADEVVMISTARQAEPAIHEHATLLLVGGGLLHGRIETGDEEVVRIVPEDIEPITVPLSDVVGFLTPAGRALSDWRERQRLPEATGNDDMLLLANGDRMTGAVVEITADGVTFEARDQITTVPHDRLLSAVLRPTSAGSRRSAGGLRARVFLTDGSRLEARALSWTPKRVTMRLYTEAEIALPGEAVVRVEVVGGRWTWLSQLEPVSFEHTPYLSLSWPWHRDRSVLGGPLRIGGVTFVRGVGVHSQSRLVYEIGDGFREFFSHIGLDDTAGPLGDVDIAVRVDGETRYRKQHIGISAPGAAAEPIRVPLDGGNRLELLVTFGRHGDVQDRFNWAGAALIR